MDKHVYLPILKENLDASANKMGLPAGGFYFQHDNDPKHTALDVKLWMLYNITHLPTPPQSPDLNPIENLWAYLEEKIREHNISSKTLLKQALLQEWEKIPEEMCRILVESMPRRLTAVCNNNGYGTKY
ncbi:Transposable element Tc1 transposase [Eumeta japonica]|uniref:Transposable element Tc1 transposase n=1 Tax=Eumeta variegata TaxID=151549 RepID=A0A4C1TPL5_EUMVA|nr:Transposable element Tc1 transposase [Eumeta japonica]